ncbi:MAG: monofunctional biosynthetic peptidoglycan transglycosylase [Alphaproteobacteria bacterium]|nr:monofunctional biosynthetic peptidoglycan transglycosylase [Alphaproteobacteria bacterium]
MIRDLVLTALLVLPGCATIPATQALMVRWASPRLTLTMLGATRDHLLETGELDLPDVRYTPMSALGSHVPRAAVSSEDGLFWVHAGFDVQGICAALEHNAKGGSVRGGSTISQQTARNVFLSQNRSWVRKGLEAYYTVWLELLVPKERILELYLNVAETGPRTFGFEAGAQHWYGRGADALSADQAARLVAILPSPNKRSPQGKLAAKKARWIADHIAPMPGDRTLEQVRERYADRPWWPLCDDGK